jgi:hypothetical protein
MTNYLVLTLVISFFIGCSKKVDNSPYTGRDPVTCGKVLEKSACSPPLPKWLITVNKNDFPENISFKINDMVALDECSGDSSPLTVSRGSDVLVEAEYFFKPNEAEKLKIEILNLGSNCLESESFYVNDDQIYTISGQDRDQLVEFVIE